MADELARSTPSSARSTCSSTQARTEATRHETRRVAAAEKLSTRHGGGRASGHEPGARVAADLNAQLVLLTKRAALMESQVDVLEGKRRPWPATAMRSGEYVEALTAFGDVPLAQRSAKTHGRSSSPTRAAMPPAVSRLLLGAQEDLRREIARAMHDGPAQSLTNIVLQAQIVERLVATRPGRCRPRGPPARGDGPADPRGDQVVHLRRPPDGPRRPRAGADAAPRRRERGQRAGIPVEFDSLGPDRRLPMDLESGLFRMLDEALAAYLSARADRVSVRLDWSDQLEVRVSASRATAETSPDPTPDETRRPQDLPPALAAMMEDRRADARDAVEAARREAIVVLPPSTWREIQGRAATLGMWRRAVGRRRRAAPGRRDAPGADARRPRPRSCRAVADERARASSSTA